MNIDQLPVEMLMNILSFLPQHREVALVNKQFYAVTCKLRDPKIHLRIKHRKNFDWLPSMRRSNREISKVEFVSLDYSRDDQQSIVSVVEWFSPTCKLLRLMDIMMDESTLHQILLVLPNVKELDLRWVDFVVKYQSSKKGCRNNDLNLKNLKSLTVIRCDDRIFDYLVRIPVGILEELRISHFRWNRWTAVLHRQLNIKRLKLEFSQDDAVPMDIFDKLKLDSLELDGYKMNSASVAAILSKQANLSSLSLTKSTVVDERIMNAVSGLSELETLVMNVTSTPNASFVKIRKLKKLKNLTLRFDAEESTAKFKILAESDNACNIKLSVIHYNSSQSRRRVVTFCTTSQKLQRYLLEDKSTGAILDRFQIVRGERT